MRPIRKFAKHVVSIDINAARTQSGKTTSIINDLCFNPLVCFNIVVPNRITALNEYAKRITKGCKHKHDLIIWKDYKPIAIGELKDRLLRNARERVQTIILYMGNLHQLKVTTIFAAQHDVQKQIEDYKVRLCIDESDEYLIAHDPENHVGKDISLNYVLDSQTPEWDKITLYTATIYSHAFAIFSDNSVLNGYKITWDLQLLRNRPKSYWGYEQINTETISKLSTTWDDKQKKLDTHNIDYLISKLRPTDSLMIVHRINACHDAILNHIQAEHDDADHPVYCIVVNQHGIRCTSRNGSAATKKFTTIEDAGSWALNEGAHKIIWIGDASLSRMASVRDNEKRLLLHNIAFLEVKKDITRIIQQGGRMTGIFDVENYPRTIYGDQETIKTWKQAIAINQYFEDHLLKYGTLTKEVFLNMPEHSNAELVSSRHRNNTTKSSHNLRYSHIYPTMQEAKLSKGRDNITELQELITKEQRDEIIRSGKLTSGLTSAGKDAEHYRLLIAGDPSGKLHERATIFNTPDGQYIDNRWCVDILNSNTKQWVATYNSKGEVLLFDSSLLGTPRSSYVSSNQMTSTV
jgi:hypothetical protein